LYNKYYKDEFENRFWGKWETLMVTQLTQHLNRDFQLTNQLTKLEQQQEWRAVIRLADGRGKERKDECKGEKDRKDECKEKKTVKEIKVSQYVPAVWAEGDKPKEDNEKEDGEVLEDLPDDSLVPLPVPPPVPTNPKEPLEKAYFVGIAQDPTTKNVYKTEPLNPDWVQRFF
jgi:hypothetical protein